MNSIDYSVARKSFLRIFILFLVLTALVAVVSVLSGEFGELQMKILGTCLTISTASIVSMACAAFIEKKKFRRLGLLGITLSVAAGSMAIIGI